MVKYSGKTSSFHHKWHDTPNPEGVEQGLRKVWFLDAQWADCPIEVEHEVRDLWNLYGLGNDNYIIDTNLAELKSMRDNPDEYSLEIEKYIENEGYKKFICKFDYLIDYIESKGIEDNDQVIIHWWW